MGMSKLMKSLPFRLVLGVAIGIIAGLIANESFMNLVVTLNYIFGQIISFCVPLIVIGFIAPSITKLGKNASRLLGVALILAYTSSLGAALFSMAAGYTLIPHMSIQSAVDGLRSLPEVVFKLDIPPIMGVMSALVFSVMIGSRRSFWRLYRRLSFRFFRFTSHLRSVPWHMRELSQNRLRSSFRLS